MLDDFNKRYTKEKTMQRLLISTILDPRNKNYLHSATNKELLIKETLNVCKYGDTDFCRMYRGPANG